MGRTKKSNKRKRKSGSSGGRPSKITNGGESVSLSETLHSANNVLFDDIALSDSVFMSISDDYHSQMNTEMATSASLTETIPDEDQSTHTPPSNTDILNYLKRIDGRISAIDKRLDALDLMGQKVVGLEADLKKLQSLVSENNKSVNEKTQKLAEQVESLSFSLGEAQDTILKLNTEKANMEDSLLYVQSQSMRNNLIFTNISESKHEKPGDCENLIRTFMYKKLRLAQNIVDDIRFERVHRVGERSYGQNGKPRNIGAKFLSFKDSETVRQAKRSRNCSSS